MLTQSRTFKVYNLLGISYLLIFMLISNTALAPISQAQDKCKTAVDDTEKMYDSGHFTQAIKLLTQCLPDSIQDKNQRIAAYRILALSYLAEDYCDEAKEAIRKIFDHKRDYRSDPVQDPKQYRDMVEEVGDELPVPFLEKIAGGKKKWFWLGGGVVAVVVVVKELTTVKEEPLPEPPGLPKYP